MSESHISRDAGRGDPECARGARDPAVIDHLREVVEALEGLHQISISTKFGTMCSILPGYSITVPQIMLFPTHRNKREKVMKLLHIDSSIQGKGSASRERTREIVARWVAERPDTEVTYLDLAAQELPHLSQKSLVRADELEAARSAEAREQFRTADVIVIGAPVYNFTIPSQLKAWIDRITVAGKTFRYTEKGPQGLAGGQQGLRGGWAVVRRA